MPHRLWRHFAGSRASWGEQSGRLSLREGNLREVFRLLARTADEKWARIAATLRSRLRRWSNDHGCRADGI